MAFLSNRYRWQNYSETKNMLEYGAALTSKTNDLKFFIYIRLSMQMLDIKKNDMLAHWQFFVGNMHNIHSMWHEKVLPLKCSKVYHMYETRDVAKESIQGTGRLLWYCY